MSAAPLQRWLAVLRKPIFLGALLVIVTLLLYGQVLHHDFIQGWDDDKYITENLHVRTVLSLANVAWAFTSLEPFYWHPVTWLSHMLDCQLFGLNSGAHHYVNALLHAANALLLFVLLQRATGALWRSLWVAALFAVHPLNVETVAWAAERKSLLSAFFSFVTLAAYGWYVQRPERKRYLAVVAAFLLALMCKPMAVTLPVVLLLVDFWPLNRHDDLAFLARCRRLSLEKLPLLVIGLAVSAITVFGERGGGAVVPLSVLPMSTRMENAVISYVAYIGKMLWPAKLGVFYPHPASTFGYSLPLAEVVASTAILACITALVFYFRRNSYAVVGWLFFLVTMLPMIGIIQVGYQGRQDHFTYIPCIGLFLVLAWGFAAVVEALSLAPVVPLLASLCLIAGYAAATSRYLHSWKNGVTLFTEARIAAGRPHPWLEQLFANALFSAGRVDEALQHYRLSCELGPRNELCHYSIAEILFSRRELHPAIEEYRLALRFTRDKNIALSCLLKSGEALVELGDFDAAEQAVRHALQIDGSNTSARSLLERMVSRRTSGGREAHGYVKPHITNKPNALDLSRPLRP